MYLTSVLLGIESIEVAVKKGTYTCTRMKYVGSYGQVDTYVFKKVRTEARLRRQSSSNKRLAT
jgi:hypothetical protein